MFIFLGFDSDLNLWATSKTKSTKKKKLRKLAERPKSRQTPPQRLVKRQGAAMTRYEFSLLVIFFSFMTSREEEI